MRILRGTRKLGREPRKRNRAALACSVDGSGTMRAQAQEGHRRCHRSSPSGPGPRSAGKGVKTKDGKTEVIAVLVVTVGMRHQDRVPDHVSRCALERIIPSLETIIDQDGPGDGA